jgi:hypothetical protein
MTAEQVSGGTTSARRFHTCDGLRRAAFAGRDHNQQLHD